MATFTAYEPFDANAFPFAPGATSYPQATSTWIQETWSDSVANYYGNNFTFSGSTLTGGTLTGGDYSDGGVLQFAVSGLSHDAVTVYNYLNAENAVGLLSYVFNGADTVNGSSGADNVSTYGGNDAIYGNGGNDKAYGNDGDDRIWGGAGSDQGWGNGGNDRLWGGAGSDKAWGGGGADRLYGGKGHDTMSGGAGADKFIFNGATASSVHSDTITDFLSGTDDIQLDNAMFTNLGAAGALTNTRFFKSAGSTANLTADDRVIYNTSNGNLYYDADGSGGGSSILIAKLTGAVDLAVTDIQVI